MITNEEQHKIMDVINISAKQTHGEVKILEWNWDNNTITVLLPYNVNKQVIDFEVEEYDDETDVEYTINKIIDAINEALQSMINLLNDCKLGEY